METVAIARVALLAVITALGVAGPSIAVVPAVANTSTDRALPLRSTLPRVLTEGSGRDFQIRPTLIGYTGDATGYIGRRDWGGKRGYLNWQTWGRWRAFGVGTVWLNNCNPDCSRGKYSSRKGSVQLSAPRNGKFATMTIAFHRRGTLYTDTRVLRRTGDFWSWIIP